MRLPWRRTPDERSPRDGPPPAEVVLEAIGFVSGPVKKPRPRGWTRIVSTVEIRSRFASRLAGLERFSHIIVVFYMDLAALAPDKPEELRLAGGRMAGILATRSQLRPNHLGVSAVPLLGVEGTTLTVRGLDAIDGTPVLDVKPYLPEYDAHSEATIPDRMPGSSRIRR
ncbi:MAG: SAM-dependent methyltransferase [Dehalococcoidia bacterium]